MSDIKEKSNFHWPSLFWFLMSAFTFAMSLISRDYSSILGALGFACMGYASIRLIPHDFFTKNMTLSTLFGKNDKTHEINIHVRPKDKIFMLLGFAFLLCDLFL